MKLDIGHVYVLSNPAMPGIVKIGHTRKANVSIRAGELSSNTSIPLPFIVEDSWLVEDPLLWESRIHTRLAFCRVAKDREFFKIKSAEAQAYINVLIYGTDDLFDSALLGMLNIVDLYRRSPRSFKESDFQLGEIEKILGGLTEGRLSPEILERINLVLKGAA